jgi:hypothetical protein
MATMPKKGPAKSFDYGTPRFEYEDLDWLAARYWPRNAKGHDLAFLGDAFAVNGFAEFPIVDEITGKLVAGHGRVEKLVKMRDAGEKPPERVVVKDGKWLVPTIRGIRFPAPGKHVLASNRGVELGGWDNALLAAALTSLGRDDLVGTGFGQDDFAAFMALDGQGAPGSGAGALAEKFLVPPFSVLDARQGYWQDRKRAWLALGIKSELGRVAPIGGGPMPLDRIPKARGQHAEADGRLRDRAAPGGSPRPAMKLRGGKTVRGDGAGRAL